MEYQIIETDDLKKTIFDLNHVTLQEFEKEYDFIDDEVFLNFKEKLIEKQDKRFLIVGDYDCDGICATTIIKRLLDYLNIKSNHYIPSRLKEGYGLNTNIVKMASDNHFDCLFLVDNGVSCLEALKLAKECGIDVFIIDHHECEKLPDVYALIHNDIVDLQYKNLSAGGLSYILSRSVYEDEMSLCLGGLTLVSDMMPMLGFNRFMVKKTMEVINKHKVFTMLNDDKDINLEDLSFSLAPKINAVSRMEPLGNPNYFIRYFKDEEFAHKYLENVNYLNDQRKALTKSMSALAQTMVDLSDDILVLKSQEFSEGLCGLVANRLLHEYNKPVIILSISPEGLLKGSGRSLDGINLFDTLKDFDKYESFGGHCGAVGLSLKEEDFVSFKEYLKGKDFSSNCYKTVIKTDADKLNFDTLNLLDSLKPFGTGFEEPLLCFENKGYKRFVVSNRFPKYTINSNLSAISFNVNHVSVDPSLFIGRLKRDGYRKNNLSFSIEDLI